MTCSCCGLIDFSLNPVSCSDSFSLSLDTRGQLTGHSPLPHSLPMIHLVYSPKFCISSFSLSLGTTVISRRNENNLYDILFFWGGGGGGGLGGEINRVYFWAMSKCSCCKLCLKLSTNIRIFFGKVSSVRGISTILRYLQFFWIFLFLLTNLSPTFYALFSLLS